MAMVRAVVTQKVMDGVATGNAMQRSWGQPGIVDAMPPSYPRPSTTALDWVDGLRGI